MASCSLKSIAWRNIWTTTTIKFVISKDTPAVTTGYVGDIFVQVGDAVTLQNPIMEIETDKYTAKEFSTVKGKVKAIHVAQDTVIDNYAPLFTMEYDTNQQ